MKMVATVEEGPLQRIERLRAKAGSLHIAAWTVSEVALVMRLMDDRVYKLTDAELGQLERLVQCTTMPPHTRIGPKDVGV